MIIFIIFSLNCYQPPSAAPRPGRCCAYSTMEGITKKYQITANQTPLSNSLALQKAKCFNEKLVIQ